MSTTTSKVCLTPVTLITGLLGSGKTTFIQTLLKQKPEEECWGLLINEFGEVGIDAAIQQAGLAKGNQNTIIEEVTGGCICCSAHIGYEQAIHTLLSQHIDRLIIEPTGLGHPAKVIDILKQSPLNKRLKLGAIFAITTPKQLNQKNWRKSALLRDLITLANQVVLNKIDQSSENEITISQQILAPLYPPKEGIILCQLTNTNTLPIFTLATQNISRPFVFLEGLAEHQLSQQQSEPFPSQLLNVTQAFLQITPRTFSIGWIFEPNILFNRVKLKAWHAQCPAALLRIKGLVKTGNEWQLINGDANQLNLTDIAWRIDSRLECIFENTNPDSDKQSILAFIRLLEAQLKPILSIRQ